MHVIVELLATVGATHLDRLLSEAEFLHQKLEGMIPLALHTPAAAVLRPRGNCASNGGHCCSHPNVHTIHLGEMVLHCESGWHQPAAGLMTGINPHVVQDHHRCHHCPCKHHPKSDNPSEYRDHMVSFKVNKNTSLGITLAINPDPPNRTFPDPQGTDKKVQDLGSVIIQSLSNNPDAAINKHNLNLSPQQGLYRPGTMVFSCRLENHRGISLPERDPFRIVQLTNAIGHILKQDKEELTITIYLHL